ncbi:UDP-Glycosyltransferase/glycogen phosphorylase [Westerdykella ornata]|uniref:UDP-Glycosyltransferase/glycogen phosphorylase n=1 Tax=Westerdykella ornata TaxID=318751 RepID=A0A6A6J6N7_WESOR|nr:UDP-Glycosyltransferase/glycogen phosphorylase [Westerdykella ornata]KAF2272065.1 UDP-Glycosyltransferase/glycogen phosphorylase [Westerdykella ornata]
MTNEQKRPGVLGNHQSPPPPTADSLNSQASISPFASQHVAELPGDLPETSSRHQAGHPSREGSRDSEWQKPEGSAYASSYRVMDMPETRATSDSLTQYYAYNTAETVPSDDDLPPPEYTEFPGQLADDNSDLGANAVVTNDGRVNIRINQKTSRLSQALLPQIQRQLASAAHEAAAPPPPYLPEILTGAPDQKPPPPLNVVIQVVGSRGDVQPFIALGKLLKETYKHRVRLATHPVFKDFVTENGLEFFSIGGDPAQLMAFMVKNPGLMPGFEALRSGDVGKRRKEIAEILRGTWRSCIEPGDGMGRDPLKSTIEEWMAGEEGAPSARNTPFIADAIIANPPSFGHVHCAEKLGIPLHMMFTMPWSPTQQFPHPLANIISTNADPKLTNYMSYTLVNLLTWQGLGDLINRFRKTSLGLDPVSALWGPNMLARMKIPFTYCWSPALIPKPQDWDRHISIAGFYFLDLASNYTPEPDLAAFLAAGEPPVYIGFGSIVVDDPDSMTRLIFEAVRKTGRRALVSKGWGGLGADLLGIPDGVFMLGNVPHDWLFKHVSAVVHHGGAGTTAAGIRAGRPTVIVPFFGDQPFWGSMTAKAGAGPPSIPFKDLTAEKLADAIEIALKPESLQQAQHLANIIAQEQGSQNGAQSFHQMLKYDDFRCMIDPHRPAVWRVRRTKVRLSAKAAAVLVEDGQLTYDDLRLFRPREYEPDEGPWDPISGGATAIMGTATQMMMGMADLPMETLKLLNIHPDSKKWKGKGRLYDRPESSTDGAPSSGSRNSSNVHVVEAESELSDNVSKNDVSANSNNSQMSSSILIPRKALPSQSVLPDTPSRQGRFLSDASHTPAERSRSVSKERRPQAASTAHTASPSDERLDSGPSFTDKLRNMNSETAIDTGKGFGKILGAAFKSPMDFSLNVARGFHNVPKLYGEDVRPVDKVTGLHSGLKTATKELGLGLYEGIGGLVVDPYKGAKKEGGVGFIKGMGRGIAGVYLRVMGGVFAFTGYAMKGLYQEAVKSKGAKVKDYIIAARISQGHEEARGLSRQERADILREWSSLKARANKTKNIHKERLEALQALLKQKPGRESKESSRERGELGSTNYPPGTTPMYPPALHEGSYVELPTARDSFSAGSTTQGTTERVANPAVTRRAIGEATTPTSFSDSLLSDTQEDEMIAQAIRASIAELERPVSSADDEDAMLQRALRASVEEAGRCGATLEEQRALEEALRRSLIPGPESKGEEEGDGRDWWDEEMSDEDQAMDGRNEGEYQRFIDMYTRQYRESILGEAAAAQGSNAGEGEELERALRESKETEDGRLEALLRQQTEEEIVMEYVKKQSLLEEEHRRRMLAEQGTGEGGNVGEERREGGDPRGS